MALWFQTILWVVRSEASIAYPGSLPIPEVTSYQRNFMNCLAKYLLYRLTLSSQMYEELCLAERRDLVGNASSESLSWALVVCDQ